MIIYPYYKLFKVEESNLLGLVGSQVIIQRKFSDSLTFVITAEGDNIYVGSKKEIDSNLSVFRLKNFDKEFFYSNSNIIFYGSLLKKRFFLWDCWDKYNNTFLLTDNYIKKYKCHEYYRGEFNLDIFSKYSSGYVYRFINPMLTYYV